MRENQSTKPIYRRVYYLASGLTYLAVLLRSILLYQGNPHLPEVVGLLLVFLLLFLIVSISSIDIGKWFHVYLSVQTILICLLMFMPDHPYYDYFTILFGILGMQAMQSLSYQNAIEWISFFFLLMGVRFISLQGVLKGFLNVILFGAVIIFLSAFSITTRRAQIANDHNQSLMKLLEDANLQLETHSDTLKRLGIARERQRLARDLHDSVTQTIFSLSG